MKRVCHWASDSDKAFDALSNKRDTSAARRLAQIASRAPTAANVRAAKAVAAAAKMPAVARMLDGVLTGCYKHDFRYKYGGRAAGKRVVVSGGRVSAASEAFSFVRQATRGDGR